MVVVFAVKYREAVIEKIWKKELFAIIGNLINETECKTILVNGVKDHVHCFFGLLPKTSVSDVLQSVKAKPSKWMNESGLLTHRFEWQKACLTDCVMQGFRCFSYSHSHIDRAFKYIQNRKLTIKKRLLEMSISGY
ncbi:MAG TPA: transposase [Hanamia sp.]|nr:transposase [Hanamia sp.]